MRSAVASCLLAGILAAAVIPRIPQLVYATGHWNSDEAVNALTLRRLVEGREFRLHPWDTTYYGLAEALLALPFVALLGWTALAFKLGALAGFLGLIPAVYGLGRRIEGTAAALVAAGLLVVFSRQAVMWSTVANGGYPLIVTWGALSFLLLHDLGAKPSRPRLAAFGFVVGFGFYVFELFSLFAICLAAWAGGNWLLRSSSTGRWRGNGRAAVWFAGGLALGLLPRLASLIYGEGSKGPSYRLADPATIAGNGRLLLEQCLEGFFGVNIDGPVEVGVHLGPPQTLALVVPMMYVAAWSYALLRVVRQTRRDRRLPTEALLVMLVPVTLLAFLVSRNPGDILSARYLLPCLASLPLLCAVALVRLARLGKPGLAASVAAGTLVALMPALQLTTFFLSRGYLPIRNPDPNSSRLLSVVQLLEARGVRGVYSDYWTSYPVTFLSAERIRAVPLDEWNRAPGDAVFVGALREVAYLFPFHRRDEIRARLATVGARTPVEIPFLPWVIFLDVAQPRPEPGAAVAR